MTGALNWMMKSNRWVVVNNQVHKVNLYGEFCERTYLAVRQILATM